MSSVCILLWTLVTLLEHDLLSGLLTADHHVLLWTFVTLLENFLLSWILTADHHVQCLYPAVDIGHLVRA